MEEEDEDEDDDDNDDDDDDDDDDDVDDGKRATRRTQRYLYFATFLNCCVVRVYIDET